MKLSPTLRSVEQYYSQKVCSFGATPRGVDWNSSESQALRFQQLLRAFEQGANWSVNDFGCGYGALADYMAEKGYAFHYHGFDISEPMIDHARRLHRNMPNCQFFADKTCLTPADYTFASGIFNVKLQANDREWLDYVLETVREIARLSIRGFAFNVLSKYCDSDRMRADLYYADPLFLFDHCKKDLSKFISLFHDYPLFEFTIAVRMS